MNGTIEGGKGEWSGRTQEGVDGREKQQIEEERERARKQAEEI